MTKNINNNKISRYKIMFLFILLIFVGCTPKEDFILKATPSMSPAKLAILPVNNLTNDIDGGNIFRQVLYNHFLEDNHGYSIQSLDQTNILLNEAGITDGGQLKFLRPIEICEILGVDGLLYVDVDQLQFLTYPYYHTRAVKSTFYLYNFEKLTWAKPIKTTIKYIGLTSAINTVGGAISGDESQMEKGMTQAAVDIGVHQGIKFATIIGFKHALAPEMAMVSEKLLTLLPRGSINNREYVKQSEKEILYLKEKISKKQSIVTDEMYIENKENVKVVEEIIPIIN